MAAGTGPYWGVIIPKGGVNHVANPSFETGTAGWAGTFAVGVSLGTVAERQAFGAWSLQASGGGDLGVTTTAALGSGSAYVASAYVRFVGALGTAQINLGGTSTRVTVPADTWQRISVGTITPSAATYTMAVMRINTGQAIYIDGAQIEAGSITTYMDGDQEGCIWAGVPHASTSIRGADQGVGGTLYPLATLGLTSEETPGIGVAPTTNQLQPYAISDGAEYQRTRYEARPFTLNTTFTGTTYTDLHITRRRVFDAIKAGRTPTPAPVRLLYWGAGGTVSIDALYSEGMDGAYNNVVAEQAAVRFVAPDPAWGDVLDQGTALAPYTLLGSTNYIAYRDPLGRWGTMQNSGTSVANGGNATEVITLLAAPTGTLYVGGLFGTAGGTISRGIAQWSGGNWGTLTGGTLGRNGASAVQLYVTTLGWMAGTLFAGGTFGTAGGTIANNVARWANGVWGTLTGGGGVDQLVYSLASDANALVYIAGRDGLKYWNGAAFGTAGTASVSARVYSVTPYGRGVVAVGQFINHIAQNSTGIATYRDGAGGTIGGGNIGTGFAVGVTSDVSIYAIRSESEGAGAGTFVRVNAGNYVVAGSAEYVPGNPQVFDILPTPTGEIYVTGVRSINGNIPTSMGYAKFNGYSFTPPDLRVVTSAGARSGTSVYAAALDAAGTLYIGGAFTGLGTAASVTTVVNRGINDAYPVLRLRHTGAGTARVYQLLNTTTQDDLYFDLVLAAGERAVLDLRPASLGFVSDTKGTIISSILGGSNLSTWHLAPGTNTVSFFADSADIRADLYWRPQHASADGGAEPTL